MLRTCLTLGAITGQAFHIDRIRAGRSTPGLKAQHLAAVRAAADLCAARLEGDALGSRELVFTPQAPVQPHRYHFPIQTAGAAMLVLHTTLLPLSLTEGESEIRYGGGTHVPHAPTLEHVEGVYLPVLVRMGLHAQLVPSRLGFFPRGGGELLLRVVPGSVTALDLSERGRLQQIRGHVSFSGLPAHVGERGVAALRQGLAGFIPTDRLELQARELPSPGQGAAVSITVGCETGLAGFSSLGERGKPIERVAEEACREFRRWHASGAAVDEHLADQLVPPLALAEGESRWTAPDVTEHLRSVLWTAQQFLPIEYAIEDRLVRLQGAGNRRW